MKFLLQKMQLSKVGVTLGILFAGLTSVNAQTQTIMEIIENSDDHDTLEIAIDRIPGLRGTLSAPNADLTVFAPTDEAFRNLDPALFASLLGDAGALANILNYHVIGSVVPSGNLTNAGYATTLQGDSVIATLAANNDVFINQAQVIAPDQNATNGVVHVTNAVFQPGVTIVDLAVSTPSLSTLTAAVVAAELVPTLTDPTMDYTVFAPTDDVFAATFTQQELSDLLATPLGTLRSVLLYHVLGSRVEAGDLPSVGNGTFVTTALGDSLILTLKDSDGSAWVDHAQIVGADAADGDNGIVHLINEVVLPASSVVDLAASTDALSTLTTAVVAAELVPTLVNPNMNYTVFAPTNDIFDAAFTQQELTDLLADPTGRLQTVLLYHVLGSRVEAGDLPSVGNGTFVTTAQGDSLILTLKASDGSAWVDHAEIVGADAADADNGIVHLIDQILIPSTTVVDLAAATDMLSTLTTAVVTAELVPVLADPTADYTVFAPTNDVFDATFTADELNDLLTTDVDVLREVLLYHVLGSRVEAGDLPSVGNGTFVTTAQGDSLILTLKTSDGSAWVDHAQIVGADAADADNGIVHLVDEVVFPLSNVVDLAAATPTLSTLTAAVVAAELVPALTDPSMDYTVFAPQDDVFAATFTTDELNALLADPTGTLQTVLLYHVLGSRVEAGDLPSVGNGTFVTTAQGDSIILTLKDSDGSAWINHAQIIGADAANSDNGIVHLINEVVMPGNTIVETAVTAGLSTLATAVIEAELVPALTNPSSNLTVFAPTNAAFDAIGADNLNALLADPTGDLQNILLYHVVGDSINSADIVGGQTSATSLYDNQNLTLAWDGSAATVDGININLGLVNVDAGNGIVHVIEGVLLPSGIVLSIFNSSDVETVSVYPNPTAGNELFINAIENGTYEIFSAQGAVIEAGEYNASNGIATSNLEDGTYFLKINTSAGVYSASFVK